MKIFKRIVFAILVLVIILISGIAIFLQTQKPRYDYTLNLDGLSGPVNVFFDKWGVPHIYASNEPDAYRAFGYVHAQDRLFQMELIRRVSSGRLSEIFGKELIDVDRFFRMLGIEQQAKIQATEYMKDASNPALIAALAYLDGINQYLENGKRPLEFRMLGIPSEKFTLKDLYLVGDFMAFNFEMAFRTDPLLSRIKHDFGDAYLNGLITGYAPGTLTVPSFQDSLNDSIFSNVLSQLEPLDSLLPISLWLGSNAMAIAPSRSRSGKVLLENDTHIGHQQPSSWYEANLNFPGTNFYGSYLAGFPFAPVGHTLHHAWGVTILENDDLDFFVEKSDSLHKDSIHYKGEWVAMEKREETIKIKGEKDILILCRSTLHGPVCNDVMSDFTGIASSPVSLCWTMLKEPGNLIDLVYHLDKASNIYEFRHQVSKLSAPGLNVVYGDSDGNIAWWAAAKFVRRPDSVNAKLLLDGSTGKNDWLGYYPFSENPQSVNPPSGIVYSSNNQPGPVNGCFYTGYYLPEDRARSLCNVFDKQGKLDTQQLRDITNNVINPVAADIAHTISSLIPDSLVNKSTLHHICYDLLKNWNGDHQLEDKGPVIYYKILYHILHSTFADELGEKEFEVFLRTHMMKNSLQPLMENDTSPWWDNLTTKDKHESRTDIIAESFTKSVAELADQLGRDPEKWKWGNVHTVEFEHAIGKQKPFDKFFNVGPFPISGGSETVNNQSFTLNGIGIYKSTLGPALRRIVDFSDPEHAFNVNPTGQSGNVMSKHYDDQVQLYLKGQFRSELMNKAEITSTSPDHLLFVPVSK